jgi:hypothetical protein
MLESRGSKARFKSNLTMLGWRQYSSTRSILDLDRRLLKLAGLIFMAVVATQVAFSHLNLFRRAFDTYSPQHTLPLPCLVHPPVFSEFDPPTPPKCGTLQRPWWDQLNQLCRRQEKLLERMCCNKTDLDNELASFYTLKRAHRFELRQMNRSLSEIPPDGCNAFVDRLGLNIILWTLGLCDTSRVRTIPVWSTWLDQAHCHLMSHETFSHWRCYSKNAEWQCNTSERPPKCLRPFNAPNGTDGEQLVRATTLAPYSLRLHSLVQ